MATGYTIEVGYISGDSYQGDTNEAWQELRAAAEQLRNSPAKLATEAREFGAPFWCCDKHCADINEFCEVYRRNWTDGGPLMIVDKPDEMFPCKDDDWQPHLHIMASGDRAMKEHVARAFCRLVMYEMHRKGIEISIRVG